MHNGGDAAEQVVRLSLEGFEVDVYKRQILSRIGFILIPMRMELR